MYEVALATAINL